MSYGFVGRAWLETEDEEMAIYSYGGEDMNLHDFEAVEAMKAIGTIVIKKSCLQEPEIHNRIKKMPNGRKKLVKKKIILFPDIGEAVRNGGVEIEKLCGIDELEGKRVPKYAFALLRHIFTDYQRNEHLPEEVSFIQ